MTTNYWQRLQEERSKKLSKLVNELKESVQLDEAGYEHGFADPNSPQLGAQAKAATKGAEMRQELGHETNNIAIAINGKTWKVVPGRGYADSKEEWSYLNNMKNWAAKKSASSGKKWTVHLTGAPVTMSEEVADEARANTAGARAGLEKRKEKMPLSPEEQIAKDRAKFEKWKAKNQKPADKGVAEGVAETVPMYDAKKILSHYGAGHFKTTSNELHFYKNGRPFSVDLIFNDDATRSVSISSLNSATRQLKGQGVAEAGNKPLEKSRFGTGDTRTPRDIKSQMSGASDEFVKSTADKTTSPFHSKVAKMQGKMAKSELRKREQGVAEGALDELHADLSAKFNELAPSIQKHKDVAGADNLFRELTLIAKQHNAIPAFKSMLNGARNNAHMDYDTNPGGFENWFWYLPLGDDLEETIGKVKSGYRLYSKKGKNLGTFPSKSGAEKHEREVQYFKHMGEDDEGAEETVDDILYKLTYANRRVQQADYLADNTKDDCRTIYELLRNPLRDDNMPEYMRMVKYVQGRYPDAWDNFSDEMDGMMTEDDDGVSEEELAEIIFNRLEMRYPRIVERFGHDVVGEAVMDVANFHAGATELGTSDISIMIHEVIKKLNTRMQEDSWHGTGDAWHGDGNDPTNMWHGTSTAGPYISNEGKK